MAETREELLLIRLAADKASAAELRSTVAAIKSDLGSLSQIQGDFNKKLADISRINAVDQLGNNFGVMAAKFKDADGAAALLTKRLQEMGATAPEIERAAQAFANAQTISEGGGGGGSSALTKFGSKLRSLPAVQLGNSSISSDAVANLIRVLGALPPAALPVIASLGAITVAFVLMNKGLEDNKKALEAALKAQDTYYKDLHSRTTESAKDQIKTLRDTNADIQKEMDNIANSIKGGVGSVKENFSGLLDAAGVLFGSAAENSLTGIITKLSPTNQSISKFDELQKSFDENASAADALERSLSDATLAANDLAQKEKELAEVRFKYAEDSIASQSATNTKLRELMRSGSEKELDDLLQSTKDQIDATKDQIAAQYELAKSFEDQPEIYGQISEKIRDLQAHQTDLTKSYDELNNATIRAYTISNDTKLAEEKRQKDSASSFQKYEEDIAKIQQDKQDAQLKSYDKYQTALVDAADSARKAAEDALRKLSEQRTDLASKFADTETDAFTKERNAELDDQIKFQRNEAKAARDHQRDLLKIVQDAKDKERDLILNRDFEGLFKLKQDTQKQVDASNNQYVQEREDRLQAFNEQQDDARRHFAQEEAQRLLNYNRQLQQAQLAFNRENEQIVRNANDKRARTIQQYNQELADESAKFTQQSELRKQAETQELTMIQQGQDAVLKIISDSYQKAIAFLSGSKQGQNIPGEKGGSLSIPKFGDSKTSTQNITQNGGVGALTLVQNIQGGADAKLIAKAAAAEFERSIRGLIS